MRLLILSDIHANWDALQAVLRSAKKYHYDKLVCLGDLVGYGPDVSRVVEWAMDEVKKGSIFVKGNHDRSISDKSEYIGHYNYAAQLAIEIHRKMTNPEHDKFLMNLPTEVVEGDITFIHGSPLGWTDYILERYEANDAIRFMKTKMCFIGHTHTPIEWQYDGYTDRRLINVGSVGQPRDGNPKACFVIFDTDEIRDNESGQVKFHRSCYDVKAAQQKMTAIGMPKYLIERLEVGG